LKHNKFGLLISRGGVATYFRCGGPWTVLYEFCSKFRNLSGSEKHFEDQLIWPSYSKLNHARFFGRSLG